MNEEIYALDTETKSLDKSSTQFALEPWRVMQSKATITDISISGPDNFGYHTTNINEIPDILHKLKGKVVYCHNAIFDVAWLIAHSDMNLDIIRKIKWFDTNLLAKWIMNGQELEYGNISLSLKACAARWLKDHELIDEFLEVKNKDVVAGEDSDYWTRRVLMDSIMTRDLAIKLESELAQAQWLGYRIEASSIVPVANSWLVGMILDGKKAKEIGERVIRAKANLAKHLGIQETVIKSPAQLGDFLYNKNGFEPITRSAKTGKGSTSKEDLLLIHHNLVTSRDYDRAALLKHILDFKQLCTLESKYVNGIERVLGYTRDGLTHGAPRIFGTYTGRFTYSSQTLKKKDFQAGIAQHQVPRKGPTKSMIGPKEGYVLAEFDASGQESRGMAIESGDHNMIDIFNSGKDFHAMTGCKVVGREYNEFKQAYHNGEKEAENQRYNGKFINLSCNYRIGSSALKKKAFTQYGIIVDFATAASWNKSFKTSYPGVPKYWEEVCKKAMMKGYTETLAGRRFRLTDWSSHKWGTESSAINFPIQGMGGDMKYLAISTIFNKIPEAVYTLDVHDANFYQLPDDDNKEELAREMLYTLNNINYEEAWDCVLPIPLLWDAKIGRNWGELYEIA